MDAAWERAQALVDGSCELSFAAGALAIACGDPVALPV
jgi:hypothetical protein